MSRVAWLSPLPPEASGIADYSAEVLGGLRHRFEIELFCGQPASLPEALGGLPARGYAQFVDEHRRHPYGAILYQVGNSPDYHKEAYWLLRQHPGIVVLHEYMLHDLVRHAGTADDFVAAMRYSYGLSAEHTAREMVAGRWQHERWSYPLFEPVVDAADYLLVHSVAARARVLRSRPAAGVSVVPLTMPSAGRPAVSDASRRALRHEVGVGEDALLVASFGHVTPHKRIPVGLRAFAQLRRRHPAARYVLAGEISPYYPELRETLAGPLGEGVIVTGRLAFPRMLELMEATDVAFNLRSPTAGETSAICVRLLSLGTPVIVNEGGWFSEIPADCCARVSVGATEEDELAAMLESLAGDAGLRQEMSRAAAAWAARALSFEAAADSYTAVLERAIHAGPRPRQAVYGEPPPPDGRAATQLVRNVAAMAAELGVRDDDEVLLPPLVDTMAQLGLTDQADAAAGAAPAARSERPRPPSPGNEHLVSPLHTGWQLAPPEGPELGTGWRKRLRGFVWNFMGPLFQRQEAFNATLDVRLDEVAGRIDSVSTSVEGVADELWKRWEATEARFDALEGEVAGRRKATEARFDAFEGEVAGRLDSVSTSVEGVADELWKRWKATEARFDALEGEVAGRLDSVSTSVEGVADELWKRWKATEARFDAFEGEVAGRLDSVSTSVEGVADELWKRWKATEARFDALEGEVAGRLDSVSTSVEGVADELWKRWKATEARFDALEELRTTVGHAQHAVRTLERELQRVTVVAPDAAPASPEAAGAPRVDEAHDAYTYVGFEHRFRGSEAEIRGRQVDYAPLFDGASDILDVGCGRGEFLDVLRERGIAGRGLDINGEMVEVCRSHGLQAEVGDALAYLRGLPDASLGGLFAAQVVEHLDPQYLIRVLAVAFQKLRPASKIVLETINSQCWFAFFDSYLRDITHVQPLHPDTLQYLLVASGFQRTTLRYSAPYPEHAKLQHVVLANGPAPTPPSDGLPSAVAVVNANVDTLNSLLFTHMDYAVIGERL